MKQSAMILTLTTVLLSGCGGAYHRAVQSATVPVENAFADALRLQYLQLAAKEKAKPDNRDALYFAQKAQAATTNLVLPDDLANRGLLWELRQNFVQERTELLSLLEQTRVRLPVESARAQAMFDCWVEESEENFQPEDILACRDQYILAKAVLRTRLDELLAAEEEARLAAEEALRQAQEAAQAQLVTPVTYEEVETVKIPEIGRVLFKLGSAELTAEAKTLLTSFVAEINAFGPQKLVVNGYTDTSGSKKLNQTLSEKRAVAVKDFLVAQGVNSPLFETAGFGETKLQVPTADGVVEPANRLVEIIMMK